MDFYLSATGETTHEIVIQRSRFICTLKRIDGFDDALSFVKSVKKKYSDATHNCYAFISNAAGTEQRFSDDGEPQGTAGQPMLEVLKKKGIFMKNDPHHENQRPKLHNISRNQPNLNFAVPHPFVKALILPDIHS